jgi:predicted metal-dependent hydrolase
VRNHGRTRKLTMRLDPQGEAVRLTAPPRIREGEIRRFLDQHAGWVERQLVRHGGRIGFTEGTMIPVEGIERRITSTGTLRGLPKLTEEALLVPGAPEHLARRVTDFCRKLAREAILPLAHAKAEEIGRDVRRVTLRDTKSRWGSCSHDGALSFSWRLILAPPLVLDYVVAHEVAHLAHMDHGPDFWRLNAELCEGDLARQRQWLRDHGRRLFRYG